MSDTIYRTFLSKSLTGGQSSRDSTCFLLDRKTPEDGCFLVVLWLMHMNIRCEHTCRTQYPVIDVSNVLELLEHSTRIYFMNNHHVI